MNIQVRIESAYGRELRYPVDPDQAQALRVLTGTRTITDAQQNALLALGHTFTETRALGRKVTG